ncbi:MAG: hypothetical protein CM1200mP22_12720 [Dehalococcoidia bacterium]|nr:MAG: hypothetical protein CM1200mP22_12720 [Dehalococcoidia bacterium]
MVSDLLDRGDPSNIALISPEGPVLTYHSLKCQVESLAGQLNSFGIGRGDRVAIVLPNGVENIVSFLAVTASGATAAPLNPAYTREEFVFCLEDVHSKAVITSSSVSDAIKEAIPEQTIDVRVGINSAGKIRFLNRNKNGFPVMKEQIGFGRYCFGIAYLRYYLSPQTGAYQS